MVPIARGATDPVSGFVVAGVCDELRFEESYETFLRMAASGIGRSVGAARARESERERADAIASLDRAKTELFSDASHELRTPLALILGNIGQVLEDGQLSASARDPLRAAQAKRDADAQTGRRAPRLLADRGRGANRPLSGNRHRAADERHCGDVSLDRGARPPSAGRRLPAAQRTGLCGPRGVGADRFQPELAHGLYPPLLASDGLYAALSATARRSPVPITIEGKELGRAPRSIESAAYFCCLEAIQNCAKHGGSGARVSVQLGMRDGVLEFRVRDDGVGFDPDAVRPGHGLINMRDRLDALGGHVEITSVPGRGTTVHGQIPLP